MNNPLGETIRQIRIEKGLSQQQPNEMFDEKLKFHMKNGRAETWRRT